MTAKKLKPVLVLDSHRGVYFGYLVKELDGGASVRLEGMKHCYSYIADDETHKGVFSLATKGPGKGSRIGPPVNCKIRDVTKIIDVEDEAVKHWETATWG